ncbi:MAG: amidohydrolase, partial [Tahibacter sp.]
MNRRIRPLILTLSLAAASAAQGADLLIEHVRGYSIDSSGVAQRFDALLIDHGKVVAVGTQATLAAQAGKARVVDGEGHVLLPGLIDAHGHVMNLGELRSQVDLTETRTLADALAIVQRHATAHPGTTWIRGRGWNQEIWKLGRFPSAADLDAVVPDRPVWLRRVDGHAGWANNAALKRAHIVAATKDPLGGRIERDATGAPSGVLVDAAMDLLEKTLPAASAAENAAMLDVALGEMTKLGLTGVHDAGIDYATFSLYKKYADARKLTTRIYAMIGDVGKDFDRLSRKGPLIGYGDDFLTVRSVKLYADGALGSRGAALLAPYSDDPGNSGLLFHPQAELDAMVGKALSKGYQVNVHAIGDRGNREILDAFAHAYAAQGGEHLRNRIEHAQVVALDDIPRFAELKLIASMQPTHATSDMNMAEQRVGAQRIRGAYAWRHFLAQGTIVAGGSDFPVESANPFFGLHAAVTRQDHANQPTAGWYPDQALSVTEALRAFTRDAAWAAHEETTQGSLEPGRWADFVLVDRDIFTTPHEDIWKTKVL